ncbi:hypothetical protein T4D_15297 [Trichinella pseudospiralis]|uniref:Uncharacterized protein n=1 Tax=Trichinella pseudospiralis TaxID=6337 RepID=A0A0V1EDB1_TRIPS|nr:hypothetical protein T4D_15297 [Trichinella pseudospiralis]
MSSAKWQTCPEWDLKYLKQTRKNANSSLLFGQVERTLPDPGAGKA